MSQVIRDDIATGTVIYGVGPDDNIFASKLMEGLEYKKAWEYEVEGVALQPVVSYGVVFFGEMYDFQSSPPAGGRFHAVDAKTGAELWVNELPSACAGAPLVSGRYVYYTDSTGGVYSVDFADGSVNWSAGIGSGTSVEFSDSKDAVIVGTDSNGVYALDKETGDVLLQYDYLDPVQFCPQPLIVLETGEAAGFLFAHEDEVVMALSEESWQTDTYVLSDDISNNIVRRENSYYLGDASGNVYRLSVDLNAVSISEEWKTSIGGGVYGIAVPVGYPGEVFISDAAGDSTMYQLDGSTGSVAKEYSYETSIESDPMAILPGGNADPQVLYGVNNGDLAVVNTSILSEFSISVLDEGEAVKKLTYGVAAPGAEKASFDTNALNGYRADIDDAKALSDPPPVVTVLGRVYAAPGGDVSPASELAEPVDDVDVVIRGGDSEGRSVSAEGRYSVAVAAEKESAEVVLAEDDMRYQSATFEISSDDWLINNNGDRENVAEKTVVLAPARRGGNVK